MKRQMLITGLLLLPIVIATTAIADTFRVQDYDNVKETEAFARYINGVGDGFSEANASLENRKQTRLYCPPVKLAIQADNYLQILGEKMKNGDYRRQLPSDMPVATILLRGLRETFPCDK